MIKHTDGRIVNVESFTIHNGRGHVHCIGYKNQSHKDRVDSDSLNEYDYQVRSRDFVIDNVLGFSQTINGGAGLWALIENFVLNRLGDGWEII